MHLMKMKKMIIKFRAWHKERYEMFKVLAMNWNIPPNGSDVDSLWLWSVSNLGGIKASLQELELMQYTGLQDYNAHDLYVGDVIKEDFLGRTGFICFGEHETSSDYYASTAYGFYIRYKDEPHSLPYRYGSSNSLQIIGNIYENPELLEQK